jgi:hypothetical protein
MILGETLLSEKKNVYPRVCGDKFEKTIVLFQSRR